MTKLSRRIAAARRADDERRAKDDLIAAMLAALKAALPALEIAGNRSAADMVRAAIAKAEPQKAEG
jgi:hypothetical protein